MRKSLLVIGTLLMIAVIANCSGHKRYHKADLGDPTPYKAHFPDIDTSGDDLVSWKEFKSYFPESNTDIYNALDLNKDGAVDHDEWHEFKEAHGLKDH